MPNVKIVRVKRLHEDAKIPELGSLYAAGADVSSTDAVTILPGDSAVVGTGLAFDIPEGYMIEAVGRSGLGFKFGIRLANCVGIVDEDYKGEVKFKLVNDGNAPFRVEVGDRIGQILLREYTQMQFEEVSELSESARGSNGFGSSGGSAHLAAH